MRVRNNLQHRRMILQRCLSVNPFVSEAQRKWMYANDPEMARRWEKHTPKDKKLPKKKKQTTSNAKRQKPYYKIDPTRSLTLRRVFARDIRRAFARLKGHVHKLLVTDDAFGLRDRIPLVPASIVTGATLRVNAFCPTGEGGGIDPTCSPSGSTGKSEGHWAEKSEVPPEPGTTPIPEGHIRAYHYYNKFPIEKGESEDDAKHKAAEALRKGGIDISKAVGHTYAEPDMVWASTEKPREEFVYAEFHIAANDPRWDIGKPDKDVNLREWEKRKTDFTFSGSIKPSEIIGVHEPWHDSYRYIKEHPDLIKEAREGKLDYLLDTEGYRPAVLKVKSELAVNISTNCSNGLHIIEVPDIRQTDHYSCGAAIAMSVGRYFGVGPETLPEWKHELGTDVEESTNPKAIVAYLRSLGLDVQEQRKMSIDNLAESTARGSPVIVPIQDYGPYIPKKARFEYGHYLAVIGVGSGYVFCQDSSEDNVIGDSGSAQKPGRVMIGESDFIKAWHDRDIEGNKYIRYGIIVSKPGGMIENAFCPTGPGGGVDPTCSPSAGSSGKIYRTPDDVEKKSSWGETHYQWKNQPGALLTGKPLSRDEIPNTLYHTTIAGPAVRESGSLLGQRADAGLGGGQEEGVSFTTSKSDAELIQRELVRSIHIAKGEKTIDDFPAMAREDEKIGGMPSGSLDVAVREARVGYDVNITGESKNPLHKESTTRDAYKSYLSSRESAATKHAGGFDKREGHPAYENLKNPMLFGKLTSMRTRDPSHVEIMTVDKSSIPRKALITTGSDDYLHEVRVYSDVPLKGGTRNVLSPVDNTRWKFASDPQKLKSFQQWVKAQIEQTVKSKKQKDDVWDRYIEMGFRKGAGRSFDDVRKARSESMGEKQPYYEGTKEEFLRSSFAQPIAKEKLELLVSRSFDELEGVTDEMDRRMTRELADGLVEGKSPRDIARDVNKEVDLGQERALRVARTEIIRAHAEGQLIALEGLGVEELGVQVEWSTAEDEDVCPECEAMEGTIIDIDDAHNMIPMHPNCRCAWIPALPEGITGNRYTTSNVRMSYFTDCPRDDHGHCLPSGTADIASKSELKEAQKLAIEKGDNVKPPTKEEKKSAAERIARIGVNEYRNEIKGNSVDRRRRREFLLNEFGDGHTCPCVYCGRRLTDSTLTQDKIYTSHEGGRYRHDNLVPACEGCNKARGDTHWENIKWSKQ